MPRIFFYQMILVDIIYIQQEPELQPSTINHQLQLQPSTTKMNRKKKPSTGNRQASTVNNQPSAVNNQPSTVSRRRFFCLRVPAFLTRRRKTVMRGGRGQRKDSHRRDETASLTGTSLCAYAIEPPCTEGYTSDCRQSYRQRREMHGESAERGRESPFCVQSMLIQEYF